MFLRRGTTTTTQKEQKKNQFHEFFREIDFTKKYILTSGYI